MGYYMRFGYTNITQWRVNCEATERKACVIRTQCVLRIYIPADCGYFFTPSVCVRMKISSKVKEQREMLKTKMKNVWHSVWFVFREFQTSYCITSWLSAIWEFLGLFSTNIISFLYPSYCESSIPADRHIWVIFHWMVLLIEKLVCFGNGSKLINLFWLFIHASMFYSNSTSIIKQIYTDLLLLFST